MMTNNLLLIILLLSLANTLVLVLLLLRERKIEFRLMKAGARLEGDKLKKIFVFPQEVGLGKRLIAEMESEKKSNV